VPHQKLFRENFASLELRRLLRRPDNGPISPSKCIGQSVHQWKFRSHDRQIWFIFFGERNNSRNITRVNGHALRLCCYPTIPWRAPYFLNARALL